MPAHLAVPFVDATQLSVVGDACGAGALVSCGEQLWRVADNAVGDSQAAVCGANGGGDAVVGQKSISMRVAHCSIRVRCILPAGGDLKGVQRTGLVVNNHHAGHRCTAEPLRAHSREVIRTWIKRKGWGGGDGHMVVQQSCDAR